MSADPGANPSAAASSALSAATQPQATPERPWLGLAHFTEADREYFFGRNAEVRELTDRVRRAPLTVLYGVSGYGKSSIIGVGLIPALRAAGHPIVLLRRCYDDLAERPLHSDVIAACVAGIPGCALPEDAPAATLWEFFHDRAQPWFQRSPSEHDAEDASGDAPISPPGPFCSSISSRRSSSKARITPHPTLPPMRALGTPCTGKVFVHRPTSPSREPDSIIKQPRWSGPPWGSNAKSGLISSRGAAVVQPSGASAAGAIAAAVVTKKSARSV
jgi:hypothetical protein